MNTIFPGNIDVNYYSQENVEFIQKKITSILSKEFYNNVIIDIPSIIRVMKRINSEKYESIPRMNQRVIMSICREFRNYQIDVNKRLKWNENSFNTLQIVNNQTAHTDVQYFPRNYDRFGSSANDKIQFYFTY